MHILTSSDEIGVKVFKNGPSKLSPRQPLKFFKGCLPKILLGPFLNILTRVKMYLIRAPQITF